MELIRENRYAGGEMLDVDIFTVRKTARVKAARSKPTSAVQEELNRKNSEKRLRRTLHLNFTEGKDYEMTVTFDGKSLPETDEETERAVKNYLRRIKRLYAKAGEGENFRYIVCMGGRDGRARKHAHITVTGSEKVSRRTLAAAWKLGTCNIDILQDKDDRMFAPLAGYLAGTKQLDRSAEGYAKNKKRWWGSRNLVKPKPAVRTGYLSKKTVRNLVYASELDIHAVEEIYSGYRVVDYEVSESNIFGDLYINLLMRRRE